jgi:hypothetical protein
VSRMGSPYRQFPFRKQPDNEAPADLIPDNGIVERFHKTMLDEFYRVASARRSMPRSMTFRSTSIFGCANSARSGPTRGSGASERRFKLSLTPSRSRRKMPSGHRRRSARRRMTKNCQSPTARRRNRSQFCKPPLPLQVLIPIGGCDLHHSLKFKHVPIVRASL